MLRSQNATKQTKAGTMIYRRLALRLLLGLVCIGTAPNATADDVIFDGKSLQGWQGNPTGKYWRVADEAITGEIPEGTQLDHNEFLFWGHEVHDFDLSLSYRISGAPSANSGIQYRSQRL